MVCLRTGSPSTALSSVSVSDLLGGTLIVMRSGYVMHRYVHRLLDGRDPAFSYSTDGAEMGQLMVAESLGSTVLPDFSIVGDPLERCGVITYRPLAAATTDALLTLQRPLAGSAPGAAHDLHEIFVRRADAYRRQRATDPAPSA